MKTGKGRLNVLKVPKDVRTNDVVEGSGKWKFLGIGLHKRKPVPSPSVVRLANHLTANVYAHPKTGLQGGKQVTGTAPKLQHPGARWDYLPRKPKNLRVVVRVAFAPTCSGLRVPVEPLRNLLTYTVAIEAIIGHNAKIRRYRFPVHRLDILHFDAHDTPEPSL